MPSVAALLSSRMWQRRSPFAPKPFAPSVSAYVSSSWSSKTPTQSMNFEHKLAHRDRGLAQGRIFYHVAAQVLTTLRSTTMSSKSSTELMEVLKLLRVVYVDWLGVLVPNRFVEHYLGDFCFVYSEQEDEEVPPRFSKSFHCKQTKSACDEKTSLVIFGPSVSFTYTSLRCRVVPIAEVVHWPNHKPSGWQGVT